MQDTYVLGIESSCDETSASVVKNGREVLSNIIFSQIDIHKIYGGVVPEIASRNHIAKIDGVVQEALNLSGVPLKQIGAVAVTKGPGLVGALLVGLSFGKALAYAENKPLIGVHHIEGHICSNYLETNIGPPFVCLVISGGHTHLVYVRGYAEYEILGRTRDDAAGEAYDKVARAIGLPYPGGVEIDKLAKTGNPNAINFPRAMIKEPNFDFSFSGLKSAVLNYINTCKMNNTQYVTEDIAASFQAAVTDTLVAKAKAACRQKACNKLALAGGVASNSKIRECMAEMCSLENISFYVPKPVFCTDNAAMIASCGYFSFVNGDLAGFDLNAYPYLEIGS